MIFILYSAANRDSISSEIGLPDYSYYFVLEKYSDVLKKMGEVVVVNDPATDVDEIYIKYKDEGRYCVFMSFTPPHKTEMGLQCPTISIFAWEYSTIPSEQWKDDRRNDWSYVLGEQSCGITHSEFSVQAVKKAMSSDFPVVSIPAPVWDDSVKYCQRNGMITSMDGFNLDVESRNLFDSKDHDLLDPLCKLAFSGEDENNKNNGGALKSIHIDGVVYTSVLNPFDGRKNWLDLLWSFCSAFLEVEDATLVLKMTHNDVFGLRAMLLEELHKLSPFKCRVIAIFGFLENEDYGKLLSGTMYIVNSAFGEGQCLPLMEFMSAGKPAVAPNHTAMNDYISPSSAFVVESNAEWTHWPHDPRVLFRAFRYRVEWESMRDAYVASYEVAKEKPKVYAVMSKNATRSLKKHCSRRVVAKKLKQFFSMHKGKIVKQVVQEQFSTRFRRRLGLC